MKKFLMIVALVTVALMASSSAFAQDEEKAEEALGDAAALEAESAEDAKSLEDKMEQRVERLEKAAVAGSTAGGKGIDPNLEEYLDHKERMARIENQDVSSDTVAAAVVPTSMFAMTVLLVFLPLYLRNKKRLAEADVQRKAIEAGLQFIPELPTRPPVKRNDRRTGLILAALGIAAAVPIALYGYPREAVFGLAFVFLGGAYFLAGKYLATEKE